MNAPPGYLGTRNPNRKPKLVLMNLLKLLGVEAAQYTFFVYLDEFGRIETLHQGKWHPMIPGDVA